MIRVFAIRRHEKSTYNYENMELLKQSYEKCMEACKRKKNVII